MAALLSRWHGVVDDEHYVVVVLGLRLLLRVFNARLRLLGVCILSCERVIFSHFLIRVLLADIRVLPWAPVGTDPWVMAARSVSIPGSVDGATNWRGPWRLSCVDHAIAIDIFLE